jgi:hypothetical protein
VFGAIANLAQNPIGYLKKDSADSDRVLSTVDSISGGDDTAEHGTEGGGEQPL